MDTVVYTNRIKELTYRAKCTLLMAVLLLGLMQTAQADTTNTFSNGNGVSIPNPVMNSTSGPGLPYPSTISVSGTSGHIVKVTVTLNTFSHTCPDDVDFMLVSPSGENVGFLLESGGCPEALRTATLTFDDAAVAAMPDTDSAFVSGTYKVSQIVHRVFPAPAPSLSSANSMSVFNGISANGIWSLYVYDCCAADSGSISGWSLSITTDAPNQTTATAIPTTNRWTLILLMLILGGVLFVHGGSSAVRNYMSGSNN